MNEEARRENVLGDQTIEGFRAAKTLGTLTHKLEKSRDREMIKFTTNKYTKNESKKITSLQKRKAKPQWLMLFYCDLSSKPGPLVLFSFKK